MMKSSDSFVTRAWIRAGRSKGISKFVAFLWLRGLPVAILKYFQVPCLLHAGYAVNASIMRGTSMRLVVLLQLVKIHQTDVCNGLCTQLLGPS